MRIVRMDERDPTRGAKQSGQHAGIEAGPPVDRDDRNSSLAGASCQFAFAAGDQLLIDSPLGQAAREEPGLPLASTPFTA